ncbi:MAG: thiamine-phosphate kinase [Planctomycetota bacterium]
MPTESDLLDHIYRRSEGLGGGVVIGPGDDCALVRGGGHAGTLLTVDQLVEHRHFLPGTGVDLIARKTVGRSVSDIAAMGGTPAWGLATGLLPAGCDFGDTLFDAMARWADGWGCPLVGGDIAFHEGPLVLTVTVGGVPSGRVLKRGAAEPGDTVYVSGRLGGSLESGRHLAVEPRVELGRQLARDESVHACIDLSDGLGRDAGRVAAASGVGIELEAERFPCHDGCDWSNALADGEDYELLFTASRPMPASLAGVAITPVGCVTEDRGCRVLTPDDRVIDASDRGWDHGS